MREHIPCARSRERSVGRSRSRYPTECWKGSRFQRPSNLSSLLALVLKASKGDRRGPARAPLASCRVWGRAARAPHSSCDPLAGERGAVSGGPMGKRVRARYVTHADGC